MKQKKENLPEFADFKIKMDNNEIISNINDFSEEEKNSLALWDNVDEKSYKKRKRKTFWTILINIFTSIAIIIVLGNLSFNLVFTVRTVSGSSMKPTFNEFVVNETDNENCDVIFYADSSINRGDIIIATHQNFLVIKRVIALEGDRIKFGINPADNKMCVFLNGEILKEDYLSEEYGNMTHKANLFNTLKSSSDWSSYFDNQGYLTIPKGFVFYLGDNRTNSSDCATYGPVEKTTIEGKVFYKVAKKELSSIKTYFAKTFQFYAYIMGLLNPKF